ARALHLDQHDQHPYPQYLFQTCCGRSRLCRRARTRAAAPVKRAPLNLAEGAPLLPACVGGLIRALLREALGIAHENNLSWDTSRIAFKCSSRNVTVLYVHLE